MLISNCNYDFGGNYFIPKVDSICDTGKERGELRDQKGKKKKRRSEFEVMLEQEIKKARKENSYESHVRQRRIYARKGA